MRTRTTLLLVVFLLLGSGLILTRCNFVDPVAPSDASIEIWANPQQIAIIGGMSELTIIITGSDGYPVPNGTVLNMVTNLGRLEYSQLQTHNGTAYNKLYSEGNGGEATVQAYSGTAGGGGGEGGGNSGASVLVTIGIDIQYVSVTANPNYLPRGGGESEITVVVFDEDFATVPSVLVSMAATAGYLESGGVPLITDQNGEARDLLTTTETSTVTATASATGGTGQEGAGDVVGSVEVVVENRFADILYLEADKTLITSCEENGDVVTLTAHCLDVNGFPVEGAFVIFDLADGSVGMLSRTSGTSDSNGEVVAYFDLSSNECYEYCPNASCSATIQAWSGDSNSGDGSTASDQVSITIDLK